MTTFFEIICLMSERQRAGRKYVGIERIQLNSVVINLIHNRPFMQYGMEYCSTPVFLVSRCAILGIARRAEITEVQLWISGNYVFIHSSVTWISGKTATRRDNIHLNFINCDLNPVNFGYPAESLTNTVVDVWIDPIGVFFRNLSNISHTQRSLWQSNQNKWWYTSFLPLCGRQNVPRAERWFTSCERLLSSSMCLINMPSDTLEFVFRPGPRKRTGLARPTFESLKCPL